MIIMATLSPETLVSLVALRDALMELPHGERSKAIDHAAGHQFGRSPKTIWRWLTQHAGYDTGRKCRADAGTTRVPDHTIALVGSMKTEGTRANGKRTVSTPLAMSLAAQNNHDVTVSRSTMNRLLRARKMDAASQASPRSHGRLRSLAPNHVHQIDPSLCLIYYMNGKQRVMRDDAFYKNKPAALDQVQMKVWRYVRYDHASGSIDARYYEAAGENQRALFDFLMYTWGRQDLRLSHGIPSILLWDKGSANTSAAICRLLDALGVQHRTHGTGHSWVKGGVECANNIVECHFESRLRFEPVETVDALNDACRRWVRDFNANAIPMMDCRIVRDSGEPFVRDDLWHRIRPEQLIALPAREVCTYFLHGAEETRVVRDLSISFKHPETKRSQIYDLRPWAEHLSQGEKVLVAPLLLRDGAVRVTIDRLGNEPLRIEVDPVTEFDDFGRSIPGTAVIGEDWLQPAQTSAERAARHLAMVAFGEDTDAAGAEEKRRKQVTPYAHANGGKPLVTHSHLGREELPERLPRRAAELDNAAIATAKRARIETPPISRTAFLLRLKREHGITLAESQRAWLAERFPDGIPEEQAAALIGQFTVPGRKAGALD